MHDSASLAAFVTPRLIVLIDLAGYTKSYQSNDDLHIAAMVQDYYALCTAAIGGAGGTLIKFMGDGCLATFAPEDAPRAVEALVALTAEIDMLAKRHQVSIALGANVHLASVVEGTFGGRLDVLGRGVNQTFLLGGGRGIRLSEPAYRALPSDARSPWTKHKPPAIYTLDQPAHGLDGQGKRGAANATRW